MDSQLGRLYSSGDFTLPLARPRRLRELSSTGFGHESASRCGYVYGIAMQFHRDIRESIILPNRSKKVFSLFEKRALTVVDSRDGARGT